MNKKVLTLLSTAFLASTLLVGCNRNNGGNNSGDDTSSGGSSGSSSSSEVAKIEDWPADLKTLLQTWCGEILPVAPLKAGNLEYDVTENWLTGTEYLEIYDNASANYLAGYDAVLAEAGWTITTDSYGDPVATKKSADGLHEYEIDIYYYQGYGNCLDCYHSVMIDTKTDNTAWTAEESEKMVFALTEEIPFMKFGSDYEIQIQGDYFQLHDTYYQDLSAAYIDLIDDLDYEDAGVDDYGDPLYVKTFADGSTITLSPYFYGGNYVYGYYTPKITTSATWPSAALTDIETACGKAIPQFTSTSYEYYSKNGAVTIQGTTSTDLSSSYVATATAAEYLETSTSSLGLWEETVSIDYRALTGYDDNGSKKVVGFEIVVALQTPDCDFFEDWPTSKIATYMESNEITVAPISCGDSYGKKYKVYEYTYDDLYEEYFETYYEEYEEYVYYELITEEEALEFAAEDAAEAAAADAGLYVAVYDLNNGATTLYEDSLNAQPWFVDSDVGYAEDGTGNCRVDYWNNNGVFYIKISKGSGKTHAPTFTLDKSTVKLSAGSDYTLSYTRSMILGIISWESSNTSVATVSDDGVVTVDVNAEVGQTATITATLGGIERTCVVTVIPPVISETLTQTSFGLVDGNQDYAEHDATGTTGSYHAQCASTHGIQIRSKNSNSGIIGSYTGHTCLSLDVFFDENTAADSDRVLDIYASNTAFTIADMYSNNMTPVGSITFDAENLSQTFEFETQYSYIGVRSHSGAIYLTSITFNW